MITRLFIKNYALIERADINFESGFTVITGETGAGKSILLGAIGLILGERADYSVLKDKESKCILESEFSIRKDEYEIFFKENDLDFETETIVRREISPSGKSRAFINDTPVNLSILKSFGSRLINIHSQNQSHQLKDEDYILSLIDSYTEKTEVLKTYKEELSKYKKKLKEYKELEESSQKLKQEADYNRFQYEEIKVLNLDNINFEELKEEVEFAENQEQITETLSQSLSLLDNDDSGVIEQLNKLKSQILSLSTISPFFEELFLRIESSAIEIADIQSEIHNQLENKNLHESPQDKIELFNEVNRLLQKHFFNDLSELIELEKELETKIDFADNSEEALSRLEKEIEQSKAILSALSNDISKERKANASKIEKEVKSLMTDLVLPHADLNFEFNIADEFRSSGMDRVKLLFNANLGGDLQEISKSASGGETSRLMLAIQYLFSCKKSLATLIFDEIDTGISGEIASKIGDLLQKISSNLQVISITHLPQVASKGDQHLKVFKQDIDNQTKTSIEILSNEGRIHEIAKMLSGEDVNSASIENAKSLLTLN